MKYRAALLCLVLSGCAAFTPDGRVDVKKSRRNAENACTYLFLTAHPVVGSAIGAWVCSFGVDSAFPDEEEEPKKPMKKRKAKPEPETEDD